MKTGICRIRGRQDPNGLTSFSWSNSIIFLFRFCLSLLYFSWSFLICGCSSCMARRLLNCLTVNGIRKIRTITVRTTIDHPQLRDSSSCMYESTVNRTSTRGCRMPKIESIRPFVLSRSSAAYSGRRFDVLRDHTLRGSTDCSAAHANPPGRIRESLILQCSQSSFIQDFEDWLPRDENHVCVAAHSALMEAECFSESALHPIANNRRAQALGNGEAHSGILRLLRIPDSFRPRKMVQDQVLVSNRAAFPVHTFEIL